MEPTHEIRLLQDMIERDAEGRLTHHPLNSRYSIDDQYGITYSHLTFCGPNITESPLFGDVKVFYLELLGRPRNAIFREGWADPLRLDLLQHASHAAGAWYLGFIEDSFQTVGWVSSFTLAWWDPLEGLQKASAPYTIVQSQIPHTDKPVFLPRVFIECSAQTLPHVFARYWPTHVAGYPIEGYLMQPGQIELLHEWDKGARDASLFREVLDKALLTFYTFPEENRDFVFVTSKLDLDALGQALDLDALRKWAVELPDEAD